ncbi:hypothetical protein [Nocardia fluminea]
MGADFDPHSDHTRTGDGSLAVAQLVVDYRALAYAADGDKPALSVVVN